MNNSIKTVIFWIVITTSAFLLWQVVRGANNNVKSIPEISYSQFLSEIDAGRVTKVKIAGTELDGNYHDGSSFRVIVPAAQEQMLAALQHKNVEVWYAKADSSTANWLANVAPLVLLAALWFVMIRQMRSRSNPTTAAASANFIAPPPAK